MKTILIVSVSALSIAACGSSKPRGEEEEEHPKLHGHTGFENTSWGMTSDALEELYPKGTEAGDDILLVGDYRGRPARLLFELKDDALVRIEIGIKTEFASMEACGEEWAKLRSEIDGTLGFSNTDNLAAYWHSNSYDVTLSCDPDESGKASMKANFAPRHEDD